MTEALFRGVFDTDFTAVIGAGEFLLCMGISLLTGAMLTAAYRYRTRCTKSFAVTLSMLPAVVCVVIMMVNGNIGAGVAVAGAFSLVRFRSVPGTAKEICALFLAMGAGLIAGMGYLGFSVLFTLVMSGVLLLCSRLDLGFSKRAGAYKTVKVVIPEDLDYTGVFDDVFRAYTSSCELVKVKSTNLGSMFKLTYSVTLLPDAKEKEMIDALRCRNGNLEITVSSQTTDVTEL